MFNWYKRIVKLEEQVNNIVRFGVIKEVLNGNNIIVDLGNGLESPPLPYLVNCSGNAKVYFAPKVGDQVIVISVAGSLFQAVVISSIYKGSVSGVADEWRLEFSKGQITYKEGKLEIKSNTDVTINSPKASINSNQIILGGEDGGEVVCKMHTCSFTGGPHSAGSSKIKGAM